MPHGPPSPQGVEFQRVSCMLKRGEAAGGSRSLPHSELSPFWLSLRWTSAPSEVQPWLNMLYSRSRIFPTLGLLESGRKLSNDHLRLSTAFPLREAKWGAPRCFPQLPKCLGLASSTESNCDGLCKLVPSDGHRYHDLKMSLNGDTQVLAMKGQSGILT